MRTNFKVLLLAGGFALAAQSISCDAAQNITRDRVADLQKATTQAEIEMAIARANAAIDPKTGSVSGRYRDTIRKAIAQAEARLTRAVPVADRVDVEPAQTVRDLAGAQAEINRLRQELAQMKSQTTNIVDKQRVEQLEQAATQAAQELAREKQQVRDLQDRLQRAETAGNNRLVAELEAKIEQIQQQSKRTQDRLESELKRVWDLYERTQEGKKTATAKRIQKLYIDLKLRVLAKRAKARVAARKAAEPTPSEAEEQESPFGEEEETPVPSADVPTPSTAEEKAEQEAARRAREAAEIRKAELEAAGGASFVGDVAEAEAAEAKTMVGSKKLAKFIENPETIYELEMNDRVFAAALEQWKETKPFLTTVTALKTPLDFVAGLYDLLHAGVTLGGWREEGASLAWNIFVKGRVKGMTISDINKHEAINTFMNKFFIANKDGIAMVLLDGEMQIAGDVLIAKTAAGKKASEILKRVLAIGQEKDPNITKEKPFLTSPALKPYVS